MDKKTDIKLNYKKINTNREKEYYIEKNIYILNLIILQKIKIKYINIFL